MLPVLFRRQITSQTVFNNYYLAAHPENRDLTGDSLNRLRAKYRIKSIVKKTILPGPAPGTGSAKTIDEIFAHGQVSCSEYHAYDQNGLLWGYSILPLDTKISPGDSASYKYVKTRGAGNEHTIELYLRNGLVKRSTYLNGRLNEIVNYNVRRNFFYHAKQTLKDTILACDVKVNFSYSKKNQLESRTYNNTEHMDPIPSCDIIESEKYAYGDREITVTKNCDKRYNSGNGKYICSLTLDNAGNILSAGYYAGSQDYDGFYVQYTCQYDRQHNLTGVFRSNDPQEPLEEPLNKFENRYDNGNRLVQAIEWMKNDTHTYMFSGEGLLLSIARMQGNMPGTVTKYEYTFY